MRVHQLHQFSVEDLEVFSSWSPEIGIRTKRSGKLPFIHWPDKHWCLEANLFMSDLLHKGYSTRGEAGTLGTKAAYLAPLIRYCFANGKRFHELTDAVFCDCVMYIYSARRNSRAGSVAAHNNTTARAITTTWLEFLHFVGIFYGDDGYVGPFGAIAATREVTEVKKGKNNSYSVSTWSHKSISVGDAERRRMPMSERNIKKLREAASSNTTDSFLRLRRLVMLELFDAVGMRRMEASNLPAMAVSNAIIEAMAPGGGISSIGFLEFPTVKRGHMRKVPLSPATLSFFAKYLKVLRLFLRKLGRNFDGSTPFFINIDTGEALKPNTFTLEFWKLAGVAKIFDPCSPHLIRHRYIVRTFIRLILAHQLEGKDDFRKMMLDQEAFLETVRQITGHSSIASLDSYITLAFEEVAELSKTMERVQMQAHFDALSRAGERYRTSIAAGLSAKEAADDLYAAVASTVPLGN
jgi:site-specific recombinase XerD